MWPPLGTDMFFWGGPCWWGEVRRTSVKGWKLEWRPTSFLVSCRRRHFVIELQDNTQCHLSTPHKSSPCSVFSRSELHWNCIINRAEMIPSNSGRIHWPLREARNKTMFLQEEYLTRGPITTSSIYSSKWMRRWKQGGSQKKEWRGNVIAYSANGSLSAQVPNIQPPYLIWAV